MRTAARVTAVLVALLAFACERRPDTEENVRKALDEANISSVDVSVDEDENVVHLSGTVETLADRTRAEEIAAAAVGTTGRVVNELTVEVLDVTPITADERITNEIYLLIDRYPVLRERDINVTVSDGTVVMTGEVRTAGEKRQAEQLVRGAPGVENVTNRLQVHSER